MNNSRALICAACVIAVGCSDSTRPAATEFLIAPGDTTVVAGTSYQLRVVARNDGAAVPIAISDVAFSSNDTRVAVVSPSGMVTTDHFGDALIRASLRARGGRLEARATVRAGAIVY